MADFVDPPASGALRELQAAGQIARAFLTAARPAEVYRLALEQVIPLVGAAFGCVFLFDEEEQLLRVVAAHNWPQTYGAYLSELRVRPGNGPTGQAFAENRRVEVSDIFADPSIQDWWDPAWELGFASTVSLPLAPHGEPVGVLTFYFHAPEEVDSVDQNLLRLVADQLAATAQKAHLIDDLQRANAKLTDQNIELEARYRDAEEARRLKSELLANVSHELRTPLTTILGYSYLLREASDTERKPDGDAVEKIEAAAGALMELINDLLDLTHLQLGRVTIEPEICDAVALTRAALSALGPPRNGVAVHSETPSEPVRMYTDPVQVLRVLRNLIGNALKFTLEGEIRVSLEGSGAPADEAEDRAHRGEPRTVRWHIADTGIGIAPQHHQAIFDEFRQVDGSATRRFGGTGLGLALARTVARRLGGDIALESDLGQGSVFTLSLPATLSPTEATSSAEPE